jgi:hypothetical protein
MTDMADYAKVIQTAVRAFLTKKRKQIATPKNLCCPITLDLFQYPVVAADGVTYEHQAFLTFVEGVLRFPTKGPLGETLANAQLVPNRSIQDLCNEFRDEHGMPIPKYMVTFSAQVQTATPVVQPRAIYQPTTTFYQIMRGNMALGDLFKTDGFLDEIRKPGLVMILNVCSSLRGFLFSASSLVPKATLINEIVRTFPDNADQIVIMLDDPDFIKHLTGAGLDCVINSFGFQRTTGNVQFKIKCVHMHLPLAVTIRDEYGEFPLSVKRSDTTENIYARVAKHRSLLKLGDEVLLLTEPLRNYKIKNGCVIDNVLRYQFRPQMAMGSDEFQIFVKTIPDVVIDNNTTLILIVKSSDTILALKNKFLDKICNNDVFKQHQDVRIMLRGLQLENDETILSDIGICADDTISALPRLLGGGPKGVKKHAKFEKTHALRAKLQYTVTSQPLLNSSVSEVCNQISQPNFIATAIANMSVEQINSLDAIANQCSRSNTLTKAVIPEFAPIYKQIEQQVALAQNSMKAIEAAVELAMVDSYWVGSTGMNTDDFYASIEDRKKTLHDETQRIEIEAEVVRRVRAAAHIDDIDMAPLG